MIVDEAITRISQRLANPEQDTTRALWGSRQPYDIFDANDSDLKHINYFFFRPEDDFDATFRDLFEIIRTDFAITRSNTPRLIYVRRNGTDADATRAFCCSIPS